MVDEAKFKQDVFDLLKSKDIHGWEVDDDRRNYGGDRVTLIYRKTIHFLIDTNEFCLYVKEVVSGETHVIVEATSRESSGYCYSVFAVEELHMLKELVRKKIQLVSRHQNRQEKHDAMKIAQTVMDLSK